MKEIFKESFNYWLTLFLQGTSKVCAVGRAWFEQWQKRSTVAVGNRWKISASSVQAFGQVLWHCIGENGVARNIHTIPKTSLSATWLWHWHRQGDRYRMGSYRLPWPKQSSIAKSRSRAIHRRWMQYNLLGCGTNHTIALRHFAGTAILCWFAHREERHVPGIQKKNIAFDLIASTFRGSLKIKRYIQWFVCHGILNSL